MTSAAAIHAIFPSIPAPTPARLASSAIAPAGAASSDDEGFSFDDFVDMVNPLQHIPVVGTLYRAITGDKMNTVPKILGDTLYGGVTGFVSSVADTIFEKVTGKSVGDTVLAFVEDVFSPDKPATGIADATPSSTASPAPVNSLVAYVPTLPDATPSSPLPLNPSPATNLAAYVPTLPTAETPAQVQPAEQDAIIVPGQDELLTALSRNGICQDMALRAAAAYRRTLSVAGTAQAAALQ